METTRSPDGTRIAFSRSGSGPALVLVHGTAGDQTRWAPVRPRLEDHFTVVAMDRRGRGASGDAEAYALESLRFNCGPLRLDRQNLRSA